MGIAPLLLGVGCTVFLALVGQNGHNRSSGGGPRIGQRGNEWEEGREGCVGVEGGVEGGYGFV